MLRRSRRAGRPRGTDRVRPLGERDAGGLRPGGPRALLGRGPTPSHGAHADAPRRSAVRAVAFVEGGRLLVTCDADGSLRWWDAATGNPCEHPLEPGEGSPPSPSAPTAARWSPAATTAGRPMGPGEGRILGPTLPHGSPVRKVAFIGDGRRILVATRDGQVRVWDLASLRVSALPPEGCGGHEPGRLSRRRSLRHRHRGRHRPPLGFDHAPPERADVQARRDGAVPGVPAGRPGPGHRAGGRDDPDLGGAAVRPDRPPAVHRGAGPCRRLRP